MKNNNMNDVLSLINSYKERLLLDKNSNAEIIDILDKMGNKENLTIEEKNKVQELIPDIEEIMERVYVINRLSERGFILDDDQIGVLNKYLDITSVFNGKVANAEDRILILEEILGEIESNRHINSSSLELLKNVFLDKSSILSLSDSIRIIEDIIGYNSNHSTTKIKGNNAIDDGVNEHINKNLLPEEELRELLSNFGYNYDDLDDYNKLYLRKHCQIDNARDILETLKKYNIILKVIKNDNENFDEKTKKRINAVFCRILSYSSSYIIESIEKDFEDIDDEEVNFSSFIKDHSNVLIPNIKGSSKVLSEDIDEDKDNETVAGSFNNYKENKEFFISKKYDFGLIVKDNSTMLLVNSDELKIKHDILEKVYGISFRGPEVGNTGFYKTSGLDALRANRDTLVSNIDRWIEVSSMGYEYIRNNPTQHLKLEESDIYRIRTIEKIKKSVFYSRGKKGVVRCTSKSAKDDEVRRILKLGKKEAGKEFDPSSKDSLGNWVPRRIFDEETINKFNLLVIGRKDIAKEWDKDDSILSNKYISYLENNCRVSENFPAYDFIYNINGTIISRKKVLRIFGQLMNPEVIDNSNGYKIMSDEDMIKFAISYGCVLNEEDVNNIENLVKEMNNSLDKVKSLTGGIYE